MRDRHVYATGLHRIQKIQIYLFYSGLIYPKGRDIPLSGNRKLPITWRSGPRQVLRNRRCSALPRISWIKPIGIRATSGSKEASDRSYLSRFTFPCGRYMVSVSVHISRPLKPILVAHAPSARRFSTCSNFAPKQVCNSNSQIFIDVQGRVSSHGLADSPSSTYSPVKNPSGHMLRGVSGVQDDTNCNNKDEMTPHEAGDGVRPK